MNYSACLSVGFHPPLLHDRSQYTPSFPSNPLFHHPASFEIQDLYPSLFAPAISLLSLLSCGSQHLLVGFSLLIDNQVVPEHLQPAARGRHPLNRKPPADKMKTPLFTFSIFAALAVAAPSATLETRQQDGHPWTPTLAGYYEKVAQHIQDARKRPGYPNPPSCDLSQATLPVAPTPLPSPDGLRLAHVAVGRGVQVSNPLLSPSRYPY